MSGTTIDSDPTDIMAAADIIGSKSWSEPKHAYHALCQDSPESMKRDIMKRLSASSPETRPQADLSIRRCATHLPKILIRRHEESRCFEDRLIELPRLQRLMITVSFPDAYLTQYDSMMSDWKNENLEKLRDQQATPVLYH